MFHRKFFSFSMWLLAMVGLFAAIAAGADKDAVQNAKEKHQRRQEAKKQLLVPIEERMKTDHVYAAYMESVSKHMNNCEKMSKGKEPPK